MLAFALPPDDRAAWSQLLDGLEWWVQQEPDPSAQGLLRLMALPQQLSKPNLAPAAWLQRLKTWLLRNVAVDPKDAPSIQGWFQGFSPHIS